MSELFLSGQVLNKAQLSILKVATGKKLTRDELTQLSENIDKHKYKDGKTKLWLPEPVFNKIREQAVESKIKDFPSQTAYYGLEDSFIEKALVFTKLRKRIDNRAKRKIRIFNHIFGEKEVENYEQEYDRIKAEAETTKFFDSTSYRMHDFEKLENVPQAVAVEGMKTPIAEEEEEVDQESGTWDATLHRTWLGKRKEEREVEEEKKEEAKPNVEESQARLDLERSFEEVLRAINDHESSVVVEKPLLDQVSEKYVELPESVIKEVIGDQEISVSEASKEAPLPTPPRNRKTYSMSDTISEVTNNSDWTVSSGSRISFNEITDNDALLSAREFLSLMTPASPAYTALHDRIHDYEPKQTPLPIPPRNRKTYSMSDTISEVTNNSDWTVSSAAGSHISFNEITDNDALLSAREFLSLMTPASPAYIALHDRIHEYESRVNIDPVTWPGLSDSTDLSTVPEYLGDEETEAETEAETEKQPKGSDILTEKDKIKFKVSFHKIPFTLFYGSVDNPNIDKTLYFDMEKLKITTDQLRKISLNVIADHGPKIFVNKLAYGGNDVRKVKQEAHELIQLHFCVMRNLATGDRIPMGKVKLSDLYKIYAPLSNQPTGPDAVDQYETAKNVAPLGSDSNTLNTDAQVVTRAAYKSDEMGRMKPTFTFPDLITKPVPTIRLVKQPNLRISGQDMSIDNKVPYIKFGKGH